MFLQILCFIWTEKLTWQWKGYIISADAVAYEQLVINPWLTKMPHKANVYIQALNSKHNTFGWNKTCVHSNLNPLTHSPSLLIWILPSIHKVYLGVKLWELIVESAVIWASYQIYQVLHTELYIFLVWGCIKRIFTLYPRGNNFLGQTSQILTFAKTLFSKLAQLL